VLPYTYVCILEGAPIVYRQGVAFIVFLPIGTHQFIVRTTDAVGTKQTTPVFSWTVESTQTPPPPLTPIQATQKLIQLKQSMHLAAAADQALDAQLNAAIQLFQHNIKSGACGHLNGFATVVHVLLQTGLFTQTQTPQLLQGVQSVERTAAC
jgi:hypothetical protein